MYSYKPKGKWLECNNCGRAHREILQSDLIDYIDKDTGNTISLSNEDLIKCTYCNPIKVYYNYYCKSCEITSLIESTFNEKKIQVCPVCEHDSQKNYNKSPAIVESIPKLDSGAKELFNRIKKRNIGSNMPDY